jgi:ATP-dependent helicase/nuclease subunit B
VSGTLELLRGARATEERLLALLAEHRDAVRADPTLLARPVRVVVPSRSLRLHVGARIVERLGSSVGVVVQTLHAVAVEALTAQGGAQLGGDPLIEVLARRLAREDGALRDAFDGFVDGYRSVAGGVRDLLDAGFEPAHLDAAVERLGEARLAADERRRVRAVLGVATRLARALEERGTGGRAELLRRAREELEADPEGVLPTHLLIVHGFADATGRATDLLEALVRRLAARVLIDRPPDPDDPDTPDLGAAYADRLVERLSGVLATVEADAPDQDGGAARTALFAAPGATAEARAVAERIARLVADGTAPERVGVVARDLRSHGSALRLQLDALGVPFSTLRARGPLDGPARRVRALCELLAQGGETPADRWLDAVARVSVEREDETVTRKVSPDLRLGLRVAGVARLTDVGALRPEEHLDAERDTLALPVRVGVKTVPAGEDPERERRWGRFRAGRRHLSGDELRAAVTAARALGRRLERWRDRAPLGEHLKELERLRRGDLGWSARDEAERRVAPALAGLAEALGDEEVGRDELGLLVERALFPAVLPTLDGQAGEGGGVLVLDAMEARGRTFDHLFVVGLNQGAFPRAAREDALLTDDVRRLLRDVLPDVPVKARGRLEDRYLFAQLVSSAEHVTLSWQLADDDGKAQVVSPLVERLLREDGAEEVEHVPPLFPQTDATDLARPRPAREHALLAGLAGGLDPEEGSFDARLALALEEAGVGGAGELAAVRRRVLGAYEEGGFRPEALGPWLGFLGAQDEVGVRQDLRTDPPFVTRFESLTRCPWRTVLESLLRLERAPDPMEALPGIEPLVLGNIAHVVLQRIVEGAIGDDDLDLAAALAREPVRVPWPDQEAFEELLLSVAREHALERHAPLPGLVRMLAECARPYLDAARAFLEREAEIDPEGGVLGVEVFGEAEVPCPSGPFVVKFRADRVERQGGEVLLSDYKTGKAVKGTRFRDEGIPRGERLQPTAYVLGARAHVDADTPATGRYLFLGAHVEEDEEIDVRVGKHHEALLPHYASAIDAMVRAWLAGTFFPRLVDPTGERTPATCKYCEVKEACLLGDSGARRALAAWGAGDEGPGGEATEALRELWGLPLRKRAKEGARKR